MVPTTGVAQDAAPGGTAAAGSPDAAAKVGAKPADANAADSKDAKTAKSGTAAETSDIEAAPQAAEEQAATTTTTTGSGDPEAIGTPKVDLPKAAGNGNLGCSIGIDAPAFHGIEPQIALTTIPRARPSSAASTRVGSAMPGGSMVLTSSNGQVRAMACQPTMPTTYTCSTARRWSPALPA